MRINPQRGVLLIIMLIAAFLRARYLLQIEHNVDQAYPIWQALQTIDRGVFPLAGQGTSVLFANPVLTGYLFVPFIALTRSPISAYVLTISLNTLGVFLAYRAIRDLLGVRVALIAAALMAVNPWVIEYSRTTWVQSLLPFFTCALAWLLWRVFVGKSKRPARRLLIAAVVLTAFTQTYLLSFAMIAPIGLLMLIFWRRVQWRVVAIGAAVFAVALALYGVGLLQQWDSVQDKLGSFTSADASFRSDAWEHALRLVSGADYAVARGQLAPIQDWELRQNLSQAVHVVLAVAVVAGIAISIINLLTAKTPTLSTTFTPKKSEENRENKERISFISSVARWFNLSPKRDAAIILLVWFGVPILAMTRVGQNIHPFYQLLGLPAGYALAAWALETVFRPQTRVGAAILTALFVPFALLMTINSARYAQETQALPGAHELYALPLEYGLQVGNAINEHLPEGGVVFSPVEDWVLNSFAGRSFLGLRDNRYPALTIYPRAGGLYIVSNPSDSILINQPPTIVSLVGLRDGVTITLDNLVEAATIETNQRLDVSSQQGVTLLGYTLETVANGWMLTTMWRIDSRVPDIDHYLFTPFAHIFDADGNRVLIVDGQPVPGYEWQVGDVHVHQMTFELPADAVAPFTIMVGQYDAGNNANVIFNLPDGTTNATVTLPETITP